MTNLAISRFCNSLSFGHIKYGWYSCDFISKEKPIFIGGCPRSGTTILYSILNSHPNISLALETGMLTGHKNLKGISKWTQIPFERVAFLYKRSCCYPEFTELVLKELMNRRNKQRWGDKSPVNVTLISSIFEHFPNSKFIHIIRDGKDVICSMRNHPPSFGFKYGSKNPWKECIMRWTNWTNSGIKWRNDNRYCEVKYEDLVFDYESEIKRILDFIGESFDPNILDNSRREKVPSHPQILKPISRSRVGIWKKELPEDMYNLFSGEPNNLLESLGYERL